MMRNLDGRTSEVIKAVTQGRVTYRQYHSFLLLEKSNMYNDKMAQERGIDGDLIACIEYNPQFFGIEDILKVLAVVEGKNDKDDWHWILVLNNGSKVYLRGGCDFTGWDCQSYAISVILEDDIDLALAAKLCRDPWNPHEEIDFIIAELEQQLLSKGKALTWSEKNILTSGIERYNKKI